MRPCRIKSAQPLLSPARAFSLNSASLAAALAFGTLARPAPIQPLTHVTPSAAAVRFSVPASDKRLRLDPTNPTDWQITNGVVAIDWDSTAGNVWGMNLVGDSQPLIDPNTLGGNGLPKGFYMDNSGPGTGTVSAGYVLVPGRYIDWWFTTASNASNAFTYTQHFILAANDPGIHVYSVFAHAASDPAGSLGQIQYVFRDNPALFTATYAVNAGPGNLGAVSIPLPSPAVMGNSDPGRQVQDATIDVHGLALPGGFNRGFETKYDYAGYEYFQEANGVYGNGYGLWAVFPRMDTLVGGPMKQNLLFTGSIVMGEMLSDHLCYGMSFPAAAGTPASRLFGPVYYRINRGADPAALYADAVGSASGALALYNREETLVANGYVPSGPRSTVTVADRAAPVPVSGTAWVVLSDPQTNQQLTAQAGQYWGSEDASGTVVLGGVSPGKYRLSAYRLGQWGEYRQDGVSVGGAASGPSQSGGSSSLAFQFTPENFSTAAPIWTFGTPDRSAREFLHGTDPSGSDDKEYWGAWNYWADFQATSGAAIAYATAVGSIPASPSPAVWNYIQWHQFDPGLFGGAYSTTDDTTDGYMYVCPAYAGSPATARVPNWQLHFTTTAAQQAQGSYVVLSVGLAATNSNLTVSLNGHSLAWNASTTTKTSDAQVRSGISGTYQWAALQWDASLLNPPGADNLLTFAVGSSQGVMYDALRMEIAATTADPAIRGWHDYEYLYNTLYTPANDALPNP